MQTVVKQSGMAMPPSGGAGAGQPSQDPAGQTDQQFEQTFADLAYAHLKDKAPRLLDHLVGFQVIEKDEDTRAIGVFGFQVGKQWMYAPVFFLNGELKGYELLYIKDQDTFVPMEENWVNYIIGRKPAVLGEGTPYDMQDMRMGQPDLSVFSRSPLRFSKHGSANMTLGQYYREGEPFDVNVVRSWFVLSPTGPTFQKVAARNDLPTALRTLGKGAVDCLLRTMRQDEKFASAIMKFYDVKDLLIRDFEKGAEGIEQFMTEAEKSKAKKKKEQLGMMPVATGEKSAAITTSGKSDIKDDPMPSGSDQIGTVEIVRVDDPSALRRDGLPDNEKVQLKRDGIVIHDHRNDTSKVYNLQEPADLINPTDTGLYALLVQPGKFRQVVVITGPRTIGKGAASCCVVVDVDSKQWVNTNAKGLYARRQYEPAEWQKFYDALPSVDSMSEGDSYVIVGLRGEGSIPFTVVKRVSNEDTTDLYVDPRTYVTRSEVLAPSGRSSTMDHAMRPSIDHENDSIRITLRRKPKSGDAILSKEDGEYVEYCRHICLTNGGGEGSMVNVGNTLMCPNTLKVIKLKHKFDDLGYAPATLADVQMALIKSGAVQHLKVWSNGTTFQIQGGQRKYASGISRPLGRLDTLQELVVAHGMVAKDAHSLVKEAKAKGQTLCLIKYAGSLLPGPMAPTMDMSGINGWDEGMGANVIEPAFRTETMDRSYEGNRDLYGPMDTSTRQVASQAASTGQKEVFDTAVLGGLVKQIDMDSSIDRYLGDLVIGLDRIGRILFMYYWHQERFKERYGQEELRELEDSLKSTFKSVGDVVLFLKKRSVQPDAAMQGTDVNLDQN